MQLPKHAIPAQLPARHRRHTSCGDVLLNGCTMLSEMKRLLVGKPLANEQLAHERLPKRTALAVFSS